MSPVNWAGLVSEISPRHTVSMCSYDGSRAGPVIEISVFATEISVTGMKIFPNEHSSTATETKLLRQNFHTRSIRISFISKVTRVHKATAAANDSRWRSIIVVEFLGFHPGRPGSNLPFEYITKFVLVTEPARLPSLYEEALNLFFFLPVNSFVDFFVEASIIRKQCIVHKGRAERSL